MAKKKETQGESTIENRVYLFKDLAAAYVQAHGGLLSSNDHGERKRALRALADLAYAACVVADTASNPAQDVAQRIADRD